MYTHILMHFNGKPYFKGVLNCPCGNMLKNKYTLFLGYIQSW